MSITWISVTKKVCWICDVQNIFERSKLLINAINMVLFDDNNEETHFTYMFAWANRALHQPTDTTSLGGGVWVDTLGRDQVGILSHLVQRQYSKYLKAYVKNYLNPIWQDILKALKILISLDTVFLY